MGKGTKRSIPEPFTAAACERLRKLRNRRTSEKLKEADEIQHRKSLEEEIEAEGPEPTKKRMTLANDYFDCLKRIDRSRALQKWYADEIDKTIKDGDSPGLWEEADVQPPTDLFTKEGSGDPQRGEKEAASESSASTPEAASTEAATASSDAGAIPRVYVPAGELRVIAEADSEAALQRSSEKEQPLTLAAKPFGVSTMPGRTFAAIKVSKKGRGIDYVVLLEVDPRDSYKRKVYETLAEVPRRDLGQGHYVGLLAKYRGTEWVCGEQIVAVDDRQKPAPAAEPTPEATPKGSPGGRAADWWNVGIAFLQVPFEAPKPMPRNQPCNSLDQLRDRLRDAGEAIGGDAVAGDLCGVNGFVVHLANQPGAFVQLLQDGRLNAKVLVTALRVVMTAHAMAPWSELPDLLAKALAGADAIKDKAIKPHAEWLADRLREHIKAIAA